MNNYKFLCLTCLSLSVVAIQPINQVAEALVHFRYAEVAGLEISFAQAKAEAEEVIEKAEASPEYREKNKGEIVAAQALTWKGVDFKPGEGERCADFVRHVLAQQNILESDVPSDKGIGEPSRPPSLGPLMADSFYNSEAGIIIKDPSYIRPGDIVMFHETYNGGGRRLPGAEGNKKITHVAIAVSDCSTGECMMIDRPTKSRPVQYRSVHTQFRSGEGSHFHSALRPHVYSQP
jgi:hypothetical protein